MEQLDKFRKVIQTNGDFESFHIDEVFPEIEKKASVFLNKGIEVFNILKEKITLTPEYVIKLDIELISNGPKLRGVPKDLNSLIDVIDEFGMPEVFISKKIYNEEGVSSMEHYLCPISFKIENIKDNFTVMYSEYKRIEDEEYTSWLSIITR